MTTTTQTPQIGQLIDGLTVGALMIDQQTGQPYALLVSPARPDAELEWDAANTWAASLGDGFRLPSRPEGAMLFANDAQLGEAAFDPEWHWLNEWSSPRFVWQQDFDGGSQCDSHNGNNSRARAVRRVDIVPQEAA